MRSSTMAATTRSPSASISASRRSSCPTSGTATTTPPASQETGHGFKMPRYDWTDAELVAKHRGLPHRPDDEGEARRDLGADAGARTARPRRPASSTRSSTTATTMADAHILRAASRTRLDPRRSRRLGRAARMRSRAARIRPGGSSTRGRTTSPNPASGSARPAAGGSPSRATSSAISSPAARPIAPTTARSIEVAPGTVVMFPAGWTRRMHRPRDDAQHLHAGLSRRTTPMTTPVMDQPARPHRPRRLGRHPDHDRGPVAHLRQAAPQGAGGALRMRPLDLHARQVGLPRHPRRVLPLPRGPLHLRPREPAR